LFREKRSKIQNEQEEIKEAEQVVRHFGFLIFIFLFFVYLLLLSFSSKAVGAQAE
jgi:flagellar biogenesis protein FliO